MKNQIRFHLATACLVLAIVLTPFTLYGQVGVATGPSTQSVSVNNMSLQESTILCGGKAQQGTPIAALGSTEGSLTISGIPATASVFKANLFWSVLTNDTSTSPGASITFNGTGVTGTNIGKAQESPCFPQAATIAYKADVTSLVKAASSTGNGTYTVAGFPGSPNFSEGATLQILWTDPNAPLQQDVLFHTSTDGLLAVTQANLFSQLISGFTTNAAGPVSASLYSVIGNGQSNGSENLRFTGPCSELNLDNSLDGSTSSKAPGTCAIGQCFWDDDVVDASSTFGCAAGNGATSATLKSDPAVSFTNDCFDWDALNFLVSTDTTGAAAACGAFVDSKCPPTATYKSHGDYVSCVSHAAEDFLVGAPAGGSCPRAEIQSSCVNPRAKSNVGK